MSDDSHSHSQVEWLASSGDEVDFLFTKPGLSTRTVQARAGKKYDRFVREKRVRTDSDPTLHGATDDRTAG